MKKLDVDVQIMLKTYLNCEHFKILIFNVLIRLEARFETNSIFAAINSFPHYTNLVEKLRMYK